MTGPKGGQVNLSAMRSIRICWHEYACDTCLWQWNVHTSQTSSIRITMNTDDKWMYVHTHNSKTWIYKGVRRAQFHLNNAVIYTCFRSAKEIKDDSSPMLLTYITNKQGTKGLVMGSASISHLGTGGRIVLVLFSTPLSLGRSVWLIDVFWLHILTNR